MSNPFETAGGSKKDSGPKFEPQKDVAEIVTSLDELNTLLDPTTFEPNQRASRELNRLVSGITAFKGVLDQINQQEYDAMMIRAQSIENKMMAANDKVQKGKDPSFNREISFWLNDQLPAVLAGLSDLQTKIG